MFSFQILEPPDMRIRLRPQESVSVAEAHAGVALMVKFTRSYPEEYVYDERFVIGNCESC